MLPNFLIIGAMKSGTTSLWKYLDAHPDTFLSYPKEPAFFVEELNWQRGWQWYESLFEGAGPAIAIGEASTHYTKLGEHKGVAERIYQHLPDAKLIYLMRDPVDRAISHYWHCVRFNHETRPLEVAIEKDTRYKDFGRYAMQLAPYQELYNADNILPITFEKLVTSPNTVLSKIYRFLDLGTPTTPHDVSQVHNGAEARVRRTNAILHAVRWSRGWTAVAPFIPARLKEWGKEREFRMVERSIVDTSIARNRLSEYYAKENERLFDLIGTRYHEWSLNNDNGNSEFAIANDAL